MDPIQGKRAFHSNFLFPMSTTYLLNRFLFPEVAAGASALFELPLATTKGAIVAVKIQCQSIAYDLYIYPFPVVDKQSILVTYQKTGINKVSIDQGLDLLWAKYSQPMIQHQTHIDDIDKSIYAEFINNGGATGDIYLELITSQAE